MSNNDVMRAAIKAHRSNPSAATFVALMLTLHDWWAAK